MTVLNRLSEGLSSKDLENWNTPQPVLTLPNDADIQTVWAPDHVTQRLVLPFCSAYLQYPLARRSPSHQAAGNQVLNAEYLSFELSYDPFKPLNGTKTGCIGRNTFSLKTARPIVFCHEWRQLMTARLMSIN